MAKPFNFGNEVKLHYKHSFVLIKEMGPAYINNVENINYDRCYIRIQFSTNGINFNSVDSLLISMNSTKVNWKYPYIKGALNYHNKVYNIKRAPYRQWTWGLSNNNTICKVEGAITQPFSRGVNLDFINCIFFPKYPMLGEAITALTKTRNMKSIAVSPDFYIMKNTLMSKNKCRFFINYKNNTIGILDKELKAIIPNKLSFIKEEVKKLFPRVVVL